MDDIDDSDVPSSGAVFTYGLSRFGDNEPGKFWVRNDKVIHVSCGEEHSVLVTESGRAFSFGKNDWGQLGVGNNLTIHNKPTCVKSLKTSGEKVRLVACGRNHTLMATESGSLYGMGNNVEKQISSGAPDTVADPFLIHSGQNFLALAAGGEMSAALLASGQVLTWGSNAEGQCGVGDDDAGLDPVAEPTRVSLPGRVVSLSCGYYHTAAVLDDGRLFAWGESDGGKLGVMHATTSQLEPQEVQVPERMRSVSCGNNHTVAVAASGRLYAWGEGPSGQLGLGEEMDTAWKPTEVTFDAPHTQITTALAGESHTIAMASDGRVFVCGDPRHGKLGLPPTGPAGDPRMIWEPEEVWRFTESDIFVYGASSGGCHTVLLGTPDAQRPPIPMPEEEICQKEVRANEEAAPKPRRRTRDRNMNGDAAGDTPNSLPPLRRPVRDQIEKREYGEQNLEPQPQLQPQPKPQAPPNRSDDEEEPPAPRRPSFDQLMQSEADSRSKFDDMLFLGDSEDEEPKRPPPRPALRSTRSLKSVSPSPAGPSGSDLLLRDEPGPSRSFSLRKDNEEDLQPKARRRAKPGLFNRGTYETEDMDDPSPEPIEAKPNRIEETQRPPADSSQLEDNKHDSLDDENHAPIESPQLNDEKVSVGCGGRKAKSTSADGSHKSKSCTLL